MYVVALCLSEKDGDCLPKWFSLKLCSWRRYLTPPHALSFSLGGAVVVVAAWIRTTSSLLRRFVDCRLHHLKSLLMIAGIFLRKACHHVCLVSWLDVGIVCTRESLAECPSFREGLTSGDDSCMRRTDEDKLSAGYPRETIHNQRVVLRLSQPKRPTDARRDGQLQVVNITCMYSNSFWKGGNRCTQRHACMQSKSQN